MLTCLSCPAAHLGIPCHAKLTGIERYCVLIAIGRTDYARLILERSGWVGRTASYTPIIHPANPWRELIRGILQPTPDPPDPTEAIRLRRASKPRGSLADAIAARSAAKSADATPGHR